MALAGDFWFIYMKKLDNWLKFGKNMGPNCRNTIV